MLLEGCFMDSKLLSDVDVVAPNGQPVRLGSLWESQPIVLALVRHFG
jgi:hypothetical protein